MAALRSLSSEEILSSARKLVSFVDASPSPYHVVAECKKRLSGAGFTELRERDAWKVEPKGKYFVTRNQSTIVAFAVGGQYRAGNGFSIVGAHTDSPCPKLKPITRKNKHGYLCVGVEFYGGGIWGTWYDRDLTVAGRVIVRRDGKLHSRLVHVRRPIMRIPHLCIHLQREMNKQFGPNLETEAVPVLGTKVMEQVNSPVTAAAVGKPDDGQSYGTEADKHQPLLIKLLCDELECLPEEISDFELCVCDTQESAIGGALQEFVFAPRLDNLMNCHTALDALIDAENLEGDSNIRVVTLFDNEEVGSNSAQGAASTLTEWILRRLSAGGSATAFEEAVSKSVLLSADQAHAVHPNYSDKHEADLRPNLHGGPVLKYNSNQKYATTAVTSAIVREAARRRNVPLQDVCVRNDSACGSTIGPILSAKLGMRTVDIGTPQLSMHSVREMACTTGVLQAKLLYQSFLEHFADIDSSLVED